MAIVAGLCHGEPKAAPYLRQQRLGIVDIRHDDATVTAIKPRGRSRQAVDFATGSDPGET